MYTPRIQISKISMANFGLSCDTQLMKYVISKMPFGVR